MKKLITILLIIAISITCWGCSSQQKEDTFTVGICQLAPHPALDAATNGFKDALTDALGDKVRFVEQNAAGDAAATAVICNSLVADNVDLILANATASLGSAANATDTIPILGTAITTYQAALGLENFDGTTHRNISGTSDLAPLDAQAQMIIDLIPDAKTVGILYCSQEANSLYQVKVVEQYLQEKGLTVTRFAFSGSNDVALVAQQACSEVDVLYIPTDNTAANCAELIGSTVLAAGIPVIAGEEGICRSCGVATLTIDYYKLGYITGQMAVEILQGNAKVEDMAIRYFDEPVYKFNKDICDKLNITVPENYQPL